MGPWTSDSIGGGQQGYRPRPEGNKEVAIEDLIATQATDLSDHFVFTIEKVEQRESGTMSQRSDTGRAI